MSIDFFHLQHTTRLAWAPYHTAFTTAFVRIYQHLASVSKCLLSIIGHISDSPGATTCQPCTPGYNQTESGEVECKPCPTGHYCKWVCVKRFFQPVYYNYTYYDYVINSFVSADGCVECSPCDIGQYQNTTGQDDCTPCPEGTYTVQNIINYRV